MKILSIETSCDETAVSIIEAKGGAERPTFKILGNALFSQTKIHEPLGGVVPNLAKRAHSKNLVPLLLKVMEDAKLSKKYSRTKICTPDIEKKLGKLLEREPDLLVHILNDLCGVKPPAIDCIAVTSGPGLEPALWVGINFAKALSLLWNKPVMPINHMEGHILSSLFDGKAIPMPALALLISGGHTELVLMKKMLAYQILGETVDDAVGEAFDKVARTLELPYPGGPQISRLAEEARNKGVLVDKKFRLPRPMLHTPNYNFSFSGLKTAVLYMVRKLPSLTEEAKSMIAFEFEEAATEVLLAKTKAAILEYGPKAIILGGGVSANTHIRRSFEKMIQEEFPDTRLIIPDRTLSTDNALMIAAAAYMRSIGGKKKIPLSFRAEGNLRLAWKNLPKNFRRDY